MNIKELQTVCHKAAHDNGWWDTAFLLEEQIGMTYVDEIISLVLQDAVIDKKAAKYALMHSELSEGLEGVRKPGPSDKIPAYTIEEEELADTIIRILDYAGRYDLRISEAIVAKLEFNKTRGHKHGGKKL